MKFEEQAKEHKNHLVALKATMDKILDVASTAERALAYYISVRDFGQCSRWKDVELKCKKLLPPDPKSFVGLTSDGEKDEKATLLAHPQQSAAGLLPLLAELMSPAYHQLWHLHFLVPES